MHLPKRWISRQFYELFAVNVGPYLKWGTPILVYQMGKVGSSSVRNSLFRHRTSETRLVFMSHEFFPVRNRNPNDISVEDRYRKTIIKEIEDAKQVFRNFSYKQKLNWLYREKLYSEMIYKNFIKDNKKAKIITLVREPISNNISMFFQVFENYAGVEYEEEHFTTEEIARIFLDKYTHFRPLTWFDVELKTMLGIDVYDYSFPKEKGYIIIKKGPLELLILKSEKCDAVKTEAIKEFLNIGKFDMVRSNIAEDKSYARQYKESKQIIRFPEKYIETMYNSKYARHFYSDVELDDLRSKWCSRDLAG